MTNLCKGNSPNTLRVLFVTSALYRSGVAIFVVNLAEALTLHETAVTILSANYCEAQARLPQQPVKVDFAWTKEQAIRFGKLSAIARRIRLIFRLIQLARQHDIVVLTCENGLLLPSLVAHLLGKPTLAIVQNNLQRPLRHYPRRRLSRWIRTWVYSKAEAVVCVSRALVSSAKEDVGLENIVSISNGIDVERVRSLAKAPYHLPLPSDGIPFIVGMGRLDCQKGFDLLIQTHAAVLKRGIQHRLVIVGEGDEHASLEALARELRVADSVIFLGFLENPYPVLAQAFLYCLSSRYEGFGLSVAEATVLGVPTVATDCVAGPREILADGQYGDLVQINSVSALSEAISNHLQSPQRLKQKAQASAARGERFSIHQCARQYRHLLKQCVHNI